jgi:hypothetical protein
MGLARDAVSYARWDARNTGGKVEVFGIEGKLFKTIEVEADERINKGYVLPGA